jgi:hypothetical protein
MASIMIGGSLGTIAISLFSATPTFAVVRARNRAFRRWSQLVDPCIAD